MQFRCCAARRLVCVWPSQSRAVFSGTSPHKHTARSDTQKIRYIFQCNAGSDFLSDLVGFSRVFVSWPAQLQASKRPGTSPPTRMGQKRPASEAEGKCAKAAEPGALVNPLRWRSVKDGQVGNGPVLYWCVFCVPRSQYMYS